MSKPAKAIYQLSCARLEVSPEEAIFVDDLAVNVEAAREMGMVAIHHQDNERTIRESEVLLG
jgi:putative hydrolase of the HAD superfamily